MERGNHYIRIYKGKGLKEQLCANERGITVGSNLGELYERIINNKLQTIIEMTEAQGGGRRGAATVARPSQIHQHIRTRDEEEKKRCLLSYSRRELEQERAREN